MPGVKHVVHKLEDSTWIKAIGVNKINTSPKLPPPSWNCSLSLRQLGPVCTPSFPQGLGDTPGILSSGYHWLYYNKQSPGGIQPSGVGWSWMDRSGGAPNHEELLKKGREVHQSASLQNRSQSTDPTLSLPPVVGAHPGIHEFILSMLPLMVAWFSFHPCTLKEQEPDCINI